MRPLHMLLAASVAVLWGGNFVAAKYSVAYFPPFYVSALRFVLVSILLSPFLKIPTKSQLRGLIPATFVSALHFSLLFAALQVGIDISTGTLVGQLGVPFACILGAIFLKDRIGPWRIFGIVVSFLGIAVVAGTPNITEHMYGFYLVLLATAAWGVANILIKQNEHFSPMQLLAWVSLGSVPVLFAFSFAFEPTRPSILEAPTSALLGLCYTAVCSTVMAYGIWYSLIARYNVSQVTPFSLLTPIFAIAFGQLYFNEELTTKVIVGGIITILGVAIIVFRRPKTIPLGEAT